MRTSVRGLRFALLALIGALTLAGAPAATASGGQISLFEDDVGLLQNPVQTLQELRHLGARMVRVNIRWSFIAPSPSSRQRPSFNASDPSAYPAGSWVPYDAIVRTASADGIKLLFTPTAFAPLWAQGPNPQKYGAHYNPEFAFMPSDSEFKQFVEAVGKRYPTVHDWEVYNEPNFGEDLAPQGIDGSHVLYAPVMYRGLINAAWGALHATGHGRDTLLIGSLAAHGAQIPSNHRPGLPGAYGETPPLSFIRDLYCLESSYRPYRGSAAAVRKCPRTAAASRRFRAQNPALFSATAWSTHPYPLGADGSTPPTKTHYTNPNFAGFSQLPNMIRTLDRIQRVYRSNKRYSVWNTEYGYITNPPNKSGTFASLAAQAYYDNWAEYLSWKSGRIASAMQYLLYDPNPSVGTPECGGFASGLVFYPTPPSPPITACSPYPPGAAKPGLSAYRLPIFVPSASTRRGAALTVWGCVRPAPYAVLDTGKPQTALVQYRRGSGSWSTVATVTYSRPSSSCYFTRKLKLQSSGAIRLIYSYPPNDPRLLPGIANTYFDPLVPSVSRTVTVTIR